ncbi:carboxylesterase [Penicillium citrinum]|uniref:Carboxylesterase n=1 Tax=Penicillium citrinum TaxID=5077 RepID=A0A9W9PCF3_PENCI|nr:carboxylesterase [Penicillium citrinum]KAJ5240342.1 carboxylesterase [Penicillium citrinum]
MNGFFAFLRYLYLKFLVTLSRFLIKCLTSSPCPKPDLSLQIPSRDQGRTINVHVYKPSVDDAGSSKPLPVLINLYGSGLAIPLHGLDDDFCRYITKATGYVVLDVNYCLAPEYPFPAALNDIEDTVRYVLDHPDEYQASQLSVSGFSSGGHSRACCLHNTPTWNFSVAFSVLPCDKPFAGPKVFREAYIREMDPRDPRISPAFADTYRFPANMLFVTGELDASAVEAEELAERAKDEHSEREVIIRRMEGCGHAFDKKLTGEMLVSARNEAYELAVKTLKRGEDISMTI